MAAAALCVSSQVERRGGPKFCRSCSPRVQQALGGWRRLVGRRAPMLSRCCPCLGRKAVEAFEQAADKKFGKPSGADKETKGLLDTYGLDEDIEEAGEEGACVRAGGRPRRGESARAVTSRRAQRTGIAAPRPRARDACAGPATLSAPPPVLRYLSKSAGVEFDVKGPISSDRIKALLDRQVPRAGRACRSCLRRAAGTRRAARGQPLLPQLTAPRFRRASPAALAVARRWRSPTRSTTSLTTTTRTTTPPPPPRRSRPKNRE